MWCGFSAVEIRDEFFWYLQENSWTCWWWWLTLCYYNRFILLALPEDHNLGLVGLMWGLGIFPTWLNILATWSQLSIILHERREFAMSCCTAVWRECRMLTLSNCVNNWCCLIGFFSHQPKAITVVRVFLECWGFYLRILWFLPGISWILGSRGYVWSPVMFSHTLYGHVCHCGIFLPYKCFGQWTWYKHNLQPLLLSIGKTSLITL